MTGKMNKREKPQRYSSPCCWVDSLYYISILYLLLRFQGVLFLHIQTRTYQRILCSPVESFSSPSSGTIFVVYHWSWTDWCRHCQTLCLSLYPHGGLRSFHQFMLSPPLISPLSTWWESRSHTGIKHMRGHCGVSAAASSGTLTLTLSAFILRREASRVLTGVKGTLISCKCWKGIWVCCSVFYPARYDRVQCWWKYLQLDRLTVWPFMPLQIRVFAINSLLTL